MYRQRTQSGFALILFVVLLLAGSLFALSESLTLSTQSKNQNYQEENFQRLKQAKEALIAYSLDYKMRNPERLDRMGILPCPDLDGGTNSNGSSDTSCGNKGVNTIGYFPYKTVGLGKTEDAAKECFWYVVSGNYKNEPYGLLNRDSVGYLKVVDENGVLQHGSDLADYPIALIISPGKNIGKNRSQVSGLSDCQANYIEDNYLEFAQGVSVQQYSSTLANTANTEWIFLQPSSASKLKDVDYNDQIIVIYKDDIWGRVEKLEDLSFDNEENPSSAIEKLTESLAECIAAYGNDNSGNPDYDLPYPAPVDLVPLNTDEDEYSNRENYNDDSSLFHGRLPQVLDNSIRSEASFIYDSVANSYCKDKVGISDEDEELWNNWKDHFFLIVSEDFISSSGVTVADKCSGSGNGCIRYDGKVLSAMLIYSGKAESNRNWKWDVALDTVVEDNKSQLSNYLEGNNANIYTGGNQSFDLVATDYAFCIEFINTSATHTAKRCEDL